MADAFWTRVDGINIYGEVTGAGDPVILIHGLAGSTRWWKQTVNALAGSFRVYALDLPGFGRTHRRVAITDLPELVVRWTRAIGLTRTHLVAHSMGAAIAIEMAAGWPALIDRLVLIDAAGLLAGTGMRRYGLDLVRAGLRTSLGLFPGIVFDALRAGPRSLLGATSEILRYDAQAPLTKVTAPTLLIWGEDDQLIPLANADEMLRLLPRSRLITIPDAGHNSMLDQPAAVNRLLLDFLREPTHRPLVTADLDEPDVDTRHGTC